MPVNIPDAPFDPSNLERSIIALPLLQMMEKDLGLIEQLKKIRPELLEKYNAAIEYVLAPPRKTRKKAQPDTPVWQSAYEEIKAIARDAGKKAEAAFYTRIMQFKQEGRAEDEVEQEREREATLRRAMSPEVYVIEEPEEVGGRYYSFARLHAAIIRRMNSAKKRADMQASLEKGAPSPIARIVPDRFDVIIDLNLEHLGGRQAARKWVYDNLEKAKNPPSASPLDQVRDDGQEIYKDKSKQSGQYVFARLEARVIKRLVELDLAHAAEEARKIAENLAPTASNVRTDAPAYRAIFHIWPDFPVSPCVTKSVATVKADAAQIAFSARGADIVWAVADSGINPHEHFLRHTISK